MEQTEKLKTFIVDNFLFGQADSLGNDTGFFEKGIIDSTGIVELVSFVEETFNIVVEDEELIPENFSSINKVSEFIKRKQSEIAKAS